MKTAHYIRKITWIGLVVNLLLAAFKMLAGIVGASQTLVADAIHSLSDCSTDTAVIIGSFYWSKPADEEHPYGHRRLETLIAVFIGIVLFMVAAGIVWNALKSLGQGASPVPGRIALVAAAVSIISKEILYRWMAGIGKSIRSPALTANAWHHRSDAISSIPALVAVSGAIFVPEWRFLDKIGAAVVSLFIFQAAVKIIWPGLREMMETGASEETCVRIRAVACQNPAVLQVHDIRTRYIGRHLQVDMHVVVDGLIPVADGHAIAEDVEARILAANLDVMDVVVHIEPFEEAVALDAGNMEPQKSCNAP